MRGKDVIGAGNPGIGIDPTAGLEDPGDKKIIVGRRVGVSDGLIADLRVPPFTGSNHEIFIIGRGDVDRNAVKEELAGVGGGSKYYKKEKPCNDQRSDGRWRMEDGRRKPEPGSRNLIDV